MSVQDPRQVIRGRKAYSYIKSAKLLCDEVRKSDLLGYDLHRDDLGKALVHLAVVLDRLQCVSRFHFIKDIDDGDL